MLQTTENQLSLSVILQNPKLQKQFSESQLATLSNIAYNQDTKPTVHITHEDITKLLNPEWTIETLNDINVGLSASINIIPIIRLDKQNFIHKNRTFIQFAALRGLDPELIYTRDINDVELTTIKRAYQYKITELVKPLITKDITWFEALNQIHAKKKEGETNG